MIQAQGLAARTDRELAILFGTLPHFVKKNYRPIVEAIAVATVPQTPEHLAEATGFTVQAIKQRLVVMIKADPRLIDETAEFLPDAQTMIGFVQNMIGGPITSANLARANEICSQLVTRIIVPRHRSFLKRELSANIDAAENVNIRLNELVEFLREDYVDFVKAEGQGLTSRAGKLNEELIRQALLSAGLVDGNDFIVTGQKSEGDIVVYHVGRPNKNLAIEVKSYGARERLLRGLADAQSPKIGVGFFNAASEFNDQRTVQFITATGALAIYLPPATLADVDPAAKLRVNSRGSVFYRPLDDLATDLLAFIARGEAAY